jgi:hypothetical protein
MALHHYLEGGKVTLVGSCAIVAPLTLAQTPTDPTTVQFIRELPDGTTHTYSLGDPEVSHLGVGIHACSVTVTQPGREKWRYQGGGACEAVAEDVFQVDASIL